MKSEPSSQTKPHTDPDPPEAGPKRARPAAPKTFREKYSLESFRNQIKHLNGDPHYVAKGMAIGIFIALTPTIPFHTVLALMLAVWFRGSKPAAVIGVWLSNPVTIPFFYLACYKVGAFLLGHRIPFDQKYDSILELAKIGMDATAALLLGGVILGIFPSVTAYFLTKRVVIKFRARKAGKIAAGNEANPYYSDHQP